MTWGEYFYLALFIGVAGFVAALIYGLTVIIFHSAFHPFDLFH